MWWLALPILFALAFAIYRSESLWPGALAKLEAETASFFEKQPLEVDKPAEIEKPVTEFSQNREDTGELVAKTTAGEIVVPVDAQELIARIQIEQVATEQNFPVLDDDIGESIESGELNLDSVKAEQEMQPDPVQTEAELQLDSVQTETGMQPDPVQVEAELQSDPVIIEKELQPDPAKVEVIEVAQNEVAQDSDVKPVVNDSQPKYSGWLDAKLQKSRDWLSNARGNNVSIQVLMRKKTSGRELINYLQNEWPLSLDKTYLYEVKFRSQLIYRVFYSEFDTLTQGRYEMQLLPESLKTNSPYLHSVYQMQKALL
jgi:hypothetical protein